MLLSNHSNREKTTIEEREEKSYCIFKSLESNLENIIYRGFKFHVDFQVIIFWQNQFTTNCKNNNKKKN